MKKKKLLAVLLIICIIFTSVAWFPQEPYALSYSGQVIRQGVEKDNSGVFSYSELDKDSLERIEQEWNAEDLEGSRPQMAMDYGSFKPAGQKWTAYTQGIKPATFSNVSYELADNVVRINSDVTENLKSMGQL